MSFRLSSSSTERLTDQSDPSELGSISVDDSVVIAVKDEVVGRDEGASELF